MSWFDDVDWTKLWIIVVSVAGFLSFFCYIGICIVRYRIRQLRRAAEARVDSGVSGLSV